MSMLFDPLRDWLLAFGSIGLVLWIVLKILAIAVPVIITVAFYVVWERKLIGWMHVRHGPMYVGMGVLHPDDAESTGLHADSVAKVGNANGAATLPVVVSDKVAPGCAWVESGYGATAPLLSGRVEVRRA